MNDQPLRHNSTDNEDNENNSNIDFRDLCSKLKGNNGQINDIAKAFNNNLDLEAMTRIELTPDEAQKSKDTMAGNTSDIGRHTNKLDINKVKQMKKNIKITRSGIQAVIIKVRGKLSTTVLEKDKEEQTIMANVDPIYHIKADCKDLEIGDLTGSDMFCAICDNQKRRKNKIASTLLDTDVRGDMMIFSTVIDITPAMINRLIDYVTRRK